MAPKAFVDPDSVPARPALGMLEAHGGGAGPSEGMTECPVCGEPLPCPAGRSAAEVVEAAGLAEASGLVTAVRSQFAYDQSTEPAYASPLAFGSPMDLPPDAPAGYPPDDLPPWAGPSAGNPVLGGRAEPVSVAFTAPGFDLPPTDLPPTGPPSHRSPDLPSFPPSDFPVSDFPASDFPASNFPAADFPPSNFPAADFPAPDSSGFPSPAF